MHLNIEERRFSKKTPLNKRNNDAVVSVEMGRNHRRRNMPGSYTYVGKHPVPNERFGICGIFERKKCIVDIPKIWKYEVRIPKPRVLV